MKNDPLTFWQATFAVALGTLIATAVQWAFVVYVMTALAAAWKPPAAPRATVSPAKVQPRVDLRPPYVQSVRPDMETGAVACLRGYTVTRESNGWSDVTSNGARLPCRDRE